MDEHRKGASKLDFKIKKRSNFLFSLEITILCCTDQVDLRSENKRLCLQSLPL
jgi:hypothetical protein